MNAIDPESNLEIFMEVAGDGPTMIIVPPPWGMSHDFYQHLIEQIDLPVRSVYFDPSGTGQSGPRPKESTPNLALEELESVQARVGPKPVLLFGHAAGAFLALDYALRHPDELAGLVLANPYASYTRSDALGAPLLETNPGWADFRRRVAEIRAVKLSPSEQFRSIYKEQRLIDLYNYDLHYLDMAAAADKSTFNAEISEDRERDLLPDLDEMHVPTLIVCGVHDALAPVAESRLIAGKLPYVRLLEFGASSHFPFIEEPENFRTAFVDFLRDIGLSDAES